MLGAGLGTASQEVPFQCRICRFWLVSSPTAHALVAEVAVTENRPVPAGQGTMAQLAPFQCSIRLPVGRLIEVKVNPTAQASAAEVAAADFSTLSGAEVLGLGTAVHEVPSQCWMSVLSAPLEVMT